MVKSRTPTPAGRARRAAIIQAALRRFLAQGVTATTLKDIQRDSGSSNGSIYHHFESKEALAGAVFADCAARYQRAFLDELRRHDDAEAAVKGIVRMHLAWCADNPEMARFLATISEPTVLEAAARELAELNERFATAMLAWWRPHAHYGSLRPLTPAQSQALWLGPAQELVRSRLLGVMAEPPTDADAEVLAEAAWLCLRAGGG